jgi:hypothetical protein
MFPIGVSRCLNGQKVSGESCVRLKSVAIDEIQNLHANRPFVDSHYPLADKCAYRARSCSRSI